MNHFEKWKAITEYKNFVFDGKYEISNWGNVRIAKTKELMKPYMSNERGYLKIRLFDKNKVRQTLYIHQLVAWNFVGIPEDNKEVNHKDFNRQNNNSDNLEWVTHLENIQKSIDGNYDVICRAKRGENNGRATFTSEKVKHIRELYATGKYSIADLLRLDHPELKEQKAYRSLWSTYANIVHNKTWKYI
jgi:hypothetical protein